MRSDTGKRHDPFGRYARKLTATEVSYIRALYRDGWSTPKLAARFGVTWQAIAYHLHRSGVVLRPRGRRRRVERIGRWVGITVTLREQETQTLVSKMIPGQPLEALGYVVETLDRLRDEDGADWRILSYSTPQSILSDLRGAVRFEAPEVIALARIDRLDLLDPAVRR